LDYNFYIVLKDNLAKNTCPRFWTWIPDFRPFRPVLGRTFQVESEIEVENKEFRHPGGKFDGKMTYEMVLFDSFSYACFFNWMLGLYV